MQNSTKSSVHLSNNNKSLRFQVRFAIWKNRFEFEDLLEHLAWHDSLIRYNCNLTSCFGLAYTTCMCRRYFSLVVVVRFTYIYIAYMACNNVCLICSFWLFFSIGFLHEFVRIVINGLLEMKNFPETRIIGRLQKELGQNVQESHLFQFAIIQL